MIQTLNRIDFISEAAKIIRQRQSRTITVEDYKKLTFSEFLDCIYGNYECLNHLPQTPEQIILENWVILLGGYLKDSGNEAAIDLREALSELQDTENKIAMVFDAIRALKDATEERVDNTPTPLELMLSIMFNIRFTAMDKEAYALQLETVTSHASRLINMYRSNCNGLKKLINEHYISPGEAHRLLVNISKVQEREVALNTITAREVAQYNRSLKENERRTA